jgi:hypothetical protein
VYKWRPAEVRGVDGVYVQIHYIGWGDEWDEVIDTSIDGDRVQPGGTMIVPRGSPRPKERGSRKQALPVGSAVDPGYKGRRGDVPTAPTGTSNAVRVTVRRRSYGDVRSEVEKKVQSKTAAGAVSRTTSANVHTTRRKSSDMVADASTLKRASSYSVSRSQESSPMKAGVASDDEYETFEDDFDEAAYQAAMKKEAEFVAALNSKGLQVVEVDADGNCLFRAVAHQLWLDEDRHLELRQRCVEHMEKHAARFVEFCFAPGGFAQHLAKIATPGEWGDDLEIKALEEITDRLISIYSSQSRNYCEPLNTNFDEAQSMKDVTPILLSYHGQNHYNSVYNDKMPLPLGERNSHVVLDMRKKSLHDDDKKQESYKLYEAIVDI